MVQIMDEHSQNPSEWAYDENFLDFSTPVALSDHGDDGSSELHSQSQRSTEGRARRNRKTNRSKSCIYAIEWAVGVMKNTRANTLATNKISNIDSYPSVFGPAELQPLIKSVATAEGLLETHSPSKVQIVCSIDQRGVKEVPYFSIGHNIDWGQLDDQIKNWSTFANRGRELLLKISYIFKPKASQGSANINTQGIQGRGATRAQFGQRSQLQNDPNTAEDYDIWERVCSILECPRGCKVGPYCWPDQETQRRYSVEVKVMQALVKYIQNGGTFETFADMPPWLQMRIRGEDKQVKAKKSNSGMQILNIMPGAATPVLDILEIDGPTKTAINRYRDWLCSTTDDPDWKDDIHAIAEFACKQRFPLHLLQEKHIQHFVDNGFPLGLATQWVMEVRAWKQHLEETQIL